MPDGNVTVEKGVPHTHSFTYAADGAAITATCANADGNCPLTGNKATLTISAPTGNLTYDGTAKAATVSGTIPGITTPDIVYTKDGAAFTGTPTEAGSYTASITVEGATASVSYTVYGAAGDLSSGKLVATVTLPANTNALLIAASYDGTGKQIGVKVIEIVNGKTTYETGLTKTSSYTYKLMLVNKTTFAPLCAAWEKKA